MDMKSRVYIIMVILIFWAGFVSSISFMEAWLKFRAEGVTLTVGLSIGKKIFTALNRSEWGFLFLYTMLFLNVSKIRPETRAMGSLLVLIILFIQTFFILPALNTRVEMIQNGQPLEKSFHHVYFGTLEILKVGLLIALAFQWYRVALRVESETGIANIQPFPNRVAKVKPPGKVLTKTKMS